MISDEKIQLLQSQHTKTFSDLQFRNMVDYLEKEEITLLSQNDPAYPSSFFLLKTAPSLLFVKGTLPSFSHSVTMVGTRNATHYGMRQAHQIAKELASTGIPIISGLARGIDSACHKGALENGTTVAILASGFAHLYPQENEPLAKIIAENGALISEYPPFMPPSRYTFIQRNRLMAALGETILLIESPEKGGSMVTMEMAYALHRPLFALPATVDMPSFKGNFHLLKTQKARLLEESQDILSYFNLSLSLPKKKAQAFLTPEEKKITQLLVGEEKGLEELLLLTQLPIMQLNALLTSLLLKGAIEEFSGKLYKNI